VGAIDVDAARAETPGSEHDVHLNNAGAALPPRSVTETVIAHLRREAEIGAYEAAEEVASRLEDVYREVATFIGAEIAEIALVESATRAWTTAFSAMRFGPGDRILTHRVEYASNFIPMLQAARRDGAVVEVVGDAPDGSIDVDHLASLLDSTVRLVALTHVPSQGGLVNPAAAVGAVTRAAGVPYFLDACQSMGQLPVDVEHIGCDVLAATGRKFLRAPRGTGFLYVRRAILDDLEPAAPDLRGAEWVDPSGYVLREDARRFEQWERSIANVLGLGEAIRYARVIGIDDIAARVRSLADELRNLLSGLTSIAVHDQGDDRCGIVTFTIDGVAPVEVVRLLRAAHVNTWAIDASTARLDLGGRALPAVVRASVHYYNTVEELDRCVQLLSAIARERRRG
jgi:cysteine desulfurase / selenocysteine lyase